VDGRILVTGASGFIGRALVSKLAAEGRTVRAAMREPVDVFPRNVETLAMSDLTSPLDWRMLLNRVDAVVHLAGIAHSGPGVAEDAYDRVNRRATAELAAAAARAGVRRIVFLSSIRAQSGPTADRVLTEDDAPQPTDPYGRSKLAAEEAVRQAGVPYTILRPTLVYGTHVKGNLANLIKIAQTPWPLPFAALRSRRSLLARENLIGAIEFVLGHEASAQSTYIVADPKPVTVGEIVRALRTAAGRPARLIPVPAALMGMAARAAGRAELWDRVGGSLVVDPSRLLAAGWRPAVETQAGLEALGRAYAPAGEAAVSG
jgi:UDP-glucose 4-epimerase